MKKNGNEKTELKLQKKYTLSDNWSTYDPFGEVFFFAAGPFFKGSVFSAPAFAFGCDWLIWVVSDWLLDTSDNGPFKVAPSNVALGSSNLEADVSKTKPIELKNPKPPQTCWFPRKAKKKIELSNVESSRMKSH